MIEKFLITYMPRLHQKLYMGDITQLEILCSADSYGLGVDLAAEARRSITDAPVRVQVVDDHAEFDNECNIVSRYHVDGGLIGHPFSFDRGVIAIALDEWEEVGC